LKLSFVPTRKKKLFLREFRVNVHPDGFLGYISHYLTPKTIVTEYKENEGYEVHVIKRSSQG